MAALWQLRQLGLSAVTVRHRIARGHLHRIHVGVYAVGHRGVSRRGIQMAAVLAYGPWSLLTHRSAADALMIRTETRTRSVDVAAPWGSGRARNGIVLHRLGSLTPPDVAESSGVPIAALPRTLLDLAAECGAVELREAIGRAQRNRDLDFGAIEELLDRSRGQRGVAILREATAEFRDRGGVTRRELERRFLSLCRRFRLPAPRVNEMIGLEHRTIQVDFHWPDAGLVVETDGYASHSDPVAHEEDRRRDQDLKLAGWEVLRFTWRQVNGEPARVARIIREMLAARTRSAS